MNAGQPIHIDAFTTCPERQISEYIKALGKIGTCRHPNIACDFYARELDLNIIVDRRCKICGHYWIEVSGDFK